MSTNKESKKIRLNIGIDEKYNQIIDLIIDKIAGITSPSGAIEWALKKSTLFLRFTEAEILLMIREKIGNVQEIIPQPIGTFKDDFDKILEDLLGLGGE